MALEFTGGKLIKIIFAIFLSLVLLCILVFALFPMILSTSWGKDRIEKSYSTKTEKLSIQTLKLSWFGPQEVTGLTITDKDGQIFSCQSVTSNASLWKLFTRHDMGELKVVNPYAKIMAKLQNVENLEKKEEQIADVKLQPLSPSGPLKIKHLPFEGHITLENGSVDIINPQIDQISFKDIGLILDISSKQSELNLNLNGNTAQANVLGTFAILANAKGTGQDAKLDLSAKIERLPVKGIDQCAALFNPELSGIIESAIGPSLDLNLNIKASSSNFDVGLSANSKQLTASLQTVTQNNLISLNKTGTLNFNISQTFAKKLFSLFPAFKNYSLKSDASANFQISQFQVPLMEEGLDWQKASFTLDLLTKNVSLVQLEPKQEIAINNLKASFSTSNLKDDLKFHLETNALLNNLPSNLILDGDVKGILSDAVTTTCELHTKQFPLAIFDSMASTSISSLLGNSLDLDLNGKFAKKGGVVAISAHTPQLDFSGAKFTINDNLQLLDPFTINYTLPPNLQKDIGVQFTDRAAFTFVIDSLILPYPVQMDKLQLTGILSFPNMTLPFPQLPINALACGVDINTFDKITLTAQSQSLQGQLVGQLKNDMFVLQKPLTLQYSIAQDHFSYLFSNSFQNKPILAEPLVLNFTLDPLSIPLERASFSNLKAKATAAIDSIKLTSSDQKPLISLQNLLLQLQVDAKGQTAAAVFSASAQEGSNIAANVNFNKINFDSGLDTSSAIVTSDLNINQLPMAVLKDLFGKSYDWGALTGPTLNLRINAKSTPEEQTFAINSQGKQFKIDASFILADGHLQLQKAPGLISLNLTQEGQVFLNQRLNANVNELKSFEFEMPATINASLSHFDLPVAKGPQQSSLLDRFTNLTPNYKLFTGETQIDIDHLSLLEKNSNQLVTLQDFIFDLTTPAIGSYTFQIEGTVSSKLAKGTAKQGSLLIDGKIENLFSTQGELTLNDPKIQFKAAVQQFPSSFFDLMANTMGPSDFKFSTLFGDTVQATLTSQIQDWTGPVSLNINSQNTRTSLVGQLDKGTLTLKEPIHAQVTMTNELSSMLLKDINPLSISSISAKNPMTLQVETDGFSIPVHPFAMENVMVPQAHIELGQITTQNEGNLNVALGLLKFKTDKGPLSLWFAPIDLHIIKGVVDWERTEILVSDKYDIAIWGKVDLIKEKVDMILGLTSQCLQAAFGIKGLPNDYVMQLPMKGKMNNVKIDSKLATAKIATLMATGENGLGGIFGGKGGAIVGGVLGTVATLPDATAYTPPAKRPFPWEAQEEQKTKKKKTSANAIKKDDKPLKQVIKALR